jgi:DNA-binding response OmpR family regulator
MEALGDSQTVVVHINRLREKIEKDPANPVHLINVRNGGYSFR